MAIRKHNDRPDILLIISDEHNVEVAGWYGNDLVRTHPQPRPADGRAGNCGRLGCEGMPIDSNP